MKSITEAYLTQIANRQVSEGEELSEGLVLVKKYSKGNRLAKVYKDRDWGEHRVEFHLDGKHQTDADYHTNDHVDAHDTAKIWVDDPLKKEENDLSEAPLGPGIVRPAHQEYTAWTKGDAYQLGFTHGKAGKKFKAPKKFGDNNQLHMAYRNGYKAGGHGHQTEEVSLSEETFKSKMHKSKANWHELSVKSNTKPSETDKDHLDAAMYHNRRAAGLPMTAWDYDFEKVKPNMVSYHIPKGKK